MSKWKKIVLPLITIIIAAGYILGASWAVQQVFDTNPTIDVLEFGDYNIIIANTEIDEEDEYQNTWYNQINSQLLFSDDTDLNELKLITLYKAYYKEGITPSLESETIILEISDSIAKDSTVRVIKYGFDKSIEIIDFSLDTRLKENGNGNEQEYYVLMFDVDQEGYYGLVSERGEANLAWIIVLVSIIGFILLFILLFVLFKRKNSVI